MGVGNGVVWAEGGSRASVPTPASAALHSCGDAGNWRAAFGALLTRVVGAEVIGACGTEIGCRKTSSAAEECYAHTRCAESGYDGGQNDEHPHGTDEPALPMKHAGVHEASIVFPVADGDAKPVRGQLRIERLEIEMLTTRLWPGGLPCVVHATAPRDDAVPRIVAFKVCGGRREKLGASRVDR